MYFIIFGFGTPLFLFQAKKYCEINFTNTPLKIDGQQKRLKGLNTVETQCIRTCCIWMIAEKQEKIILENFQPLQNIIGNRRLIYWDTIRFPI